MTDYLDSDDVVVAGAAALGTVPDVADYGLLESAVARPRATAFGLDAYPDLGTKAAALLQSLARNHPFVDGNKRTAWAATWTFLAVNDIELDPTFDVDCAERLVLDMATGVLQSIDEIGVALTTFAGRERLW